MNTAKLMMSATVIMVALSSMPIYAVTSSDQDIQTINVEVDASNSPFVFTLDPVKGLKPGFIIDGETLARGKIIGDQPQQYGVVFDSPEAKNSATFTGRNNSSNLLRVKLWVSPEVDYGGTSFGRWFIFPTAQEVSFEVVKYNAAMVNADIYTIMMYATIYTP